VVVNKNFDIVRQDWLQEIIYEISLSIRRFIDDAGAQHARVGTTCQGRRQAVEKASSLKERGRRQKAEGKIADLLGFLDRFCLLPCAFLPSGWVFSGLLVERPRRGRQRHRPPGGQ
jgi:hypothetical protein